MTVLMNESFESRLWRWGGNVFPAYRRSGAKIVYVAADFHEVHIQIPSNWKTRNHMGITWGGSLYSALDPIFGVMLHKLLGGNFRVVDKEANIQFKRPAHKTLTAKFKISHEELAGIKQDLLNATEYSLKKNIERHYCIELLDNEGVVHVTCKKGLAIGTNKGS